MEGDERKSTIWLSMIAFPLTFIISSVLIFFNVTHNIDILNTTDDVNATIVQLERDSFYDADDEHHEVSHAYVNYEYEGQEYNNIYIGTISTIYDNGDSIEVRVSKDAPTSACTTNEMDIFFPMVGVIVFAVFGFYCLYKVIKWQYEDIKEAKSKGDKVIIAFRLPTKGELIVGLFLAALVSLFVILQIYVLNGMIIGAIVFGFFFMIWIDVCLLK